MQERKALNAQLDTLRKADRVLTRDPEIMNLIGSTDDDLLHELRRDAAEQKSSGKQAKGPDIEALVKGIGIEPEMPKVGPKGPEEAKHMQPPANRASTPVKPAHDEPPKKEPTTMPANSQVITQAPAHGPAHAPAPAPAPPAANPPGKATTNLFGKKQ